MTGSAETTGLAALFERAARRCQDAFAAHIEAAGPDRRFQQQTLFTVATLDGCAARPELEEADIRLVLGAASDAAAICRTQPPDAALVAAVACLEEVVAACRHALAQPHDPPSQRLRFLFPDADLEVQRSDRQWRVQAAGRVAERNVLDLALEDALGLRPIRIAELAIAILDWFERGLVRPEATTRSPTTP